MSKAKVPDEGGDGDAPASVGRRISAAEWARAHRDLLQPVTIGFADATSNSLSHIDVVVEGTKKTVVTE
ncbi:hypothetical protein KAJ83_14310 [Marivibrio halodurans]|uniref:Uncharacterized protein n=1 Tax=Marivibrio halodurans TaxID=2039722 RepID=A0A8J7S7D6_9PROT|nr:hypothetical protein [Marivibrio halodurans]MBP5858189.1 hypothetical protein [Marivibrio halodurans]